MMNFKPYKNYNILRTKSLRQYFHTVNNIFHLKNKPKKKLLYPRFLWLVNPYNIFDQNLINRVVDPKEVTIDVIFFHVWFNYFQRIVPTFTADIVMIYELVSVK